jgi:hypothetical protein
MSGDEPVEIYCQKITETDLAILVTDDGGENEYWIPKSQIDSEFSEDHGDGTLTLFIPEWLAEKKGLL